MAFHPAQPYALQHRDGNMGMGMGRQPGSVPDAYDDFLDQYLTFEDTTDAMNGTATGNGNVIGNGAGAASAVAHGQSASPFLPRSAMANNHSEPSPRASDDLMLQFPRPPQQSPQHQGTDDQQQQQNDHDQDHDNDHEHEHLQPQLQQ
ncbi:hypothetical protein O988_09176, partial [Pseudogymnoascus sp. VKM F-3808]